MYVKALKIYNLASFFILLDFESKNWKQILEMGQTITMENNRKRVSYL